MSHGNPKEYMIVELVIHSIVYPPEFKVKALLRIGILCLREKPLGIQFVQAQYYRLGVSNREERNQKIGGRLRYAKRLAAVTGWGGYPTPP